MFNYNKLGSCIASELVVIISLPLKGYLVYR
mgnify:CR=1 FL=1|jgi:hypothetical protein